MSKRSLKDIMSHAIEGFQCPIGEAFVAKALVEKIGIDRASEMFEQSFVEKEITPEYASVWDIPDETPVTVLVTNLSKPADELEVISISHIEYCSGNQICPMVVFTVE